MTQRVDKDSLPLNQPRRTPSHPTKSHIVKTKVDGKEKILRFGEQGASTAGKPKAGESERMKAKRASFKARHGKNIAKGQSSPAYWANKVKWAEGGAVSLDSLAAKYDDGGEVSVEDLIARLESATPLERQTYETLGMEPGLDRATFLPIAGSRSGGDLQMAVPQFIYDIGKAFVTPGAAMQGVPLSYEDVVNMAGNTMGGGLAISSPVEGAVAGMAVKNKGGNWMDKSVAEEVAPLKARVMGQDPAIRLRDVEEAYAQNVEAGVPVDDAFMQRMREQTMPDIAINNWLDTKLNKYIRNEMGTPEDPVRALAESGTLHFEPQQRGPQVIEELRQIRDMEGLPGAGLGQSELAQRWETATDTAIAPGQARNYLSSVFSTERYPWLLKVPPETKVYDLAVSNNMGALGFNHLVDELRNATRPDTDLPERLRIDYNKLDRMTVPQIVEKVADINAWRAEKADAANFAKATNAAVQVVKDYPDTNLGWRQIRMPEGETDTTALQEALKYEGDSMGHSVGGYARKGGYGHGGLDAILDGRAQVFSLRDSRGQPHVTIEIKKPELKLDDLRQHLGNDENLVEDYLIKGHQARQAAGDSDTRSSLGHAIELAGVPQGRYQITQVKGKGNGMPADKYQPAIQDFIRSGNYEVTGDLQNTGLYSAKEIVNLMPKNLTMSRNTRQLAIGRARQANDLPDYLTMPEYEAVLMKYVPEDIWQAEKTKRAAEDDELFRQLRSPEGFAAGGPVNLEQLAARYADGGDVEEDNWLEKAMSLDTPEMTLGETAADIAAGFAPGVGSAMSLRDFERARRDNDYLGMALSGIGVIPVVGGVARSVNKARKAGLDELYQAYTAADRANAGRRAAELISSQEPVKASEALGQLMERGFRNTTTTQADRTRVGGGNIGGAPFSAISEVDPGYAGKVWGVMDEGTASRLTNLTTPETAWTTMLGSSTQLKTNPIVFDKLKRAFVDSMKKGNLSDELAGKINHNLALEFGEGVDIRDPKIWQLADTFDKRAALANAMMGQGIAPKKGGVALGGELRGGAIFNPSQILIRETERALLHPKHGGNVPTFAAGPRAFSLDKATEYRPDLHPGFPTLIQGRDLGVNMIPTPTEVYLPDWHRAFKTANPDRKAPGYYDLALGVKDQGLPSQALNDEYIRHLIREGFAEGGEVSLDELNDKYLPPMSNAELLAQIDRSTANSPAPAYGTASSAPRDSVQTDSRNMLERFTSLNTPQDMSLGETLTDIGMGFVPVVGTAQGARDFERARRDSDKLGMVLSAASMIPVVGGAVKAARTVGKAAKAADDLAALTAQAPLDMSQAARMQRAAEQGFDTSRPLYHSTNASFDAFEIPENRFRKYGKGVYTSPNPNYVDRYIRENRDIESGYKEGANVMPLYARGKIASEKDWEAARQEMMSEGVAPAGYNPQQKEIQRRLKEKGFDGLNMFGNEIIVFDPKNIRSINAAFDPAKRGSANLGYAQGGAVRAYDPQQIENIMSSINAPRNYASGGSVLAYNPGRVDAILNQFRGAV